MTETSEPLEPSTWAHGEVITIRPRTSLADQIEDLLHEFDDVESKRIIADEIMNRLLGETEWQIQMDDGYTEQLADEESARRYQEAGWKVFSRQASAWVEVPPWMT